MRYSIPGVYEFNLDAKEVHPKLGNNPKLRSFAGLHMKQFYS